MIVYRNYYGASIESGIGVQSQSAEIKQIALDGILKELSSMHALESSEHEKEMLSYLIKKGTYSILGVSYTEQPKSSGYNRSAPCGIQYVIPEKELACSSAELGSIVNFVSFQKPESSNPAPLNSIPRNESGYTFHNSPSIMAPIVDSLIHVALSSGNEILVIALPKGKNSEYATARYTIAEMLCYLPNALRMNICFFTGLPVQEGKTDPIEGLDNAVRLGANVIFCPNEYFRTLTSHRNCYSVDMDQPSGKAGAFAQFITSAPDISDGLATVLSCMNGPLTYDSLNKAAEQARKGEVKSIEIIQTRLTETENEYRLLKQELRTITFDNQQLQKKYDQFRQQNDNLRQQNEQLEQLNAKLSQQNSRLSQQMAKQRKSDTRQMADYIVEKDPPKVLKFLLHVFVILFFMAAAILAYNGITRGFSRVFDFSQIKPEIINPAEPGNETIIGNPEEKEPEMHDKEVVPNEAGQEPAVKISEENDSEKQTAEAWTAMLAGSDAAGSVEEQSDIATDRLDLTEENEMAAEPTAEPTTSPDEQNTKYPTAKPTAKPTETPSEGTSEISNSLITGGPENEPASITEGLAGNEIEAETNAKNVNFRESPSITGTVIEQLHKKGTRITVIGPAEGADEKEWYKIRYNGKTGYIMADYVRLINDTTEQ